MVVGDGVKEQLMLAFETNASMTVAALAAKTRIKPNSITTALRRNPQLFRALHVAGAAIAWELLPQALKEATVPVITSLKMGCEERKEVLSQIARWPLSYDLILTPRQKIEAIAELNKMEGSYAPERHQVDVTERIANFVFILPDGSRVTPQQLSGAGDRKVVDIEGEAT